MKVRCNYKGSGACPQVNLDLGPLRLVQMHHNRLCQYKKKGHIKDRRMI